MTVGRWTGTKVGAGVPNTRDGAVRPCCRCGIDIRPRSGTKRPKCRDCRALEQAKGGGVPGGCMD